MFFNKHSLSLNTAIILSVPTNQAFQFIHLHFGFSPGGSLSGGRGVMPRRSHRQPSLTSSPSSKAFVLSPRDAHNRLSPLRTTNDVQHDNSSGRVAFWRGTLSLLVPHCQAVIPSLRVLVTLGLRVKQTIFCFYYACVLFCVCVSEVRHFIPPAGGYYYIAL